ncbi:glycerol-3-phosphate acyltransferase [Candidatus Woesearchaeota archaeon]|nr:glycerol-3-phosphate acyltransferase [Candidatus Woesearchaeota archaeon]
MTNDILLVIIAYLLGSLSPSHLFGRWKGIDLRQVGTKNLGTTNVLFQFGKLPALFTLLLDAGKGALAVWVAWKWDGTPIILYFCAIASILGHIFPIYLHFRGGKGVATSIGAALGLTMASIIQYLPFVGVAVLVLISYAISMMVYRTIKHKQPDVKPIRKLIRLCGIVFPLVYFWHGRDTALWVTGPILLLFGLIDVLRLSNTALNKSIFKAVSFFVKEKETKTISTTTALLISLTASIYLFDKTIVLITSVLFIVSDAVAEIYGKSYGKHRLFHEKTVEGTTAGLAANFLLSMPLFLLLDTTATTLLIASIAVSAAELLSYKLDDNLTTIFIASFVIKIAG